MKYKNIFILALEVVYSIGIMKLGTCLVDMHACKVMWFHRFGPQICMKMKGNKLRNTLIACTLSWYTTIQVDGLNSTPSSSFNNCFNLVPFYSSSVARILFQNSSWALQKPWPLH